MRISGLFRPSRASCALLVAFFSVTIPGLLTSEAEAQWAAFVNDTAARMSSSPLEAGITTITDNQEKDFAWADLDKDGDTELV